MARVHPSDGPSRGSRRWLALAAAAGLLAGADQVIQHALLRDGYLLGRRIAPFDPPLFWSAQEEVVERIEADLATGAAPSGGFELDAELGWWGGEESGSGEYVYDWSGSRVGVSPLARERVPGVRRVAVFGDSFTVGTEVAAQDSWPAQLDAADERLEVANLGVAAYGIDQAYLRYRRVAARVEPDEVWLGFLPAAALRVLSMYWPAMRHLNSHGLRINCRR